MNNNPKKRIFIDLQKENKRPLSPDGINPNVKLSKQTKSLPKYVYDFKKKYFNKTPKNKGGL